MEALDDKLKYVFERCKCGIFIVINEHRDYYEPAEKALEDARRNGYLPKTKNNVLNKMIEKDTIVTIQVYPDTPIGSYKVCHWDLEKALDEIIEILKQ